MKFWARRSTWTAFAAAGAILLGLGAQAAPADKYEGGLDRVLQSTAPGEKIPVLVAFTGAIDTRELQKDTERFDLAARRKYVIDRLRTNLQRQAAKPIAWILAEKADGRADHVHELWIANSYVLHLRADRISVLADFPEVARVRYDRPVSIEEAIDERPDPAQQAPYQPDERSVESISWGTEHVGGTALWAQGFTGRGVLVADIDTGVELDHPDLADHIWTNAGEIPGNGIDDDGNGYIDDVHGWNFYDDDGDVWDVHGHGTRTSGVICGDGTNGDTTGVAPDATLMVLRNWSSGWSSESTHPLAVQYAVANGAQVISCSMSYVRDEQNGWIPDYVTLRTAHANSLAAGLIQANSTGNNGTSIGTPWNINAPANCPPPWSPPAQLNPGGHTAILACGMYRNTTYDADPLSDRGPSSWEDPSYPEEFQDYPWANGTEQGLLRPDVVGPSGIPTTTLNGAYRTSFSGTSASTPCLAGALVLLRGIHQQAGPEALAEAIMMTAEDGGVAGFDSVYGAGRFRVDLAHDYLDSMFAYGSLQVNATSSTGDPLDSVLVLADDGVVHQVLEGGAGLLPRLVPGTYTVTLRAEGFNDSVVDNVAITTGDTTTIDVVLSTFDSGITPESVNENLEVADTLDVAFSVNNSNPDPRHFQLSLEPRGGLDWDQDGGYDLGPLEGGVDVSAAAFFDGHLVVAGSRGGADANFWRFNPDGTLLDSLLQPDVLGVEPTRDLASGDGVLYAGRDAFIFTLNTDFEPVDTLDVSDRVTRVVGLAHDAASGDFYFSGFPNSPLVYRVASNGNLLEVLTVDQMPVGIAYDPAGPYLYLLNYGSEGLARLDRYSFASASDEPMVNLAIDVQNEAVSLDINGQDSPFWNLLVLQQHGGVKRFEREVKQAVYSLPATVDAPNGATSVGLSLYGPALPASRSSEFDVVWNNVTDGWVVHVPVTVQVGESGVGEAEETALPRTIALLPPYPNPFNPSVRLTYRLASKERVRLTVYDLLGREVARLVDGAAAPGEHTVTWRAAGHATGMYIAVLQAGGATRVRKLMLIK